MTCLAVPLYLEDMGEGKVRDTDFSTATYALFDLMDGINTGLEPGFFRFGEGGLALHPLYFNKLGVTALYIHIDTLLTDKNNMILARISRIQYGPTLFPYGPCTAWDIMHYLLYITSRSHHKNTYKERRHNVTSMFEGSLDPPTHRISANHLRHCTVAELRSIGLAYFEQNCDFILNCLDRLIGVGCNESMICGLLLWAASVPDPIKSLVASSAIWTWKYDSETHFVNTLKAKFTSRLKALQNLIDVDLTPLFELEVLVNRGPGQVDWSAERLHRTQPTTANISPTFTYNTAVGLFNKARAQRVRVNKLTWEQFWARRWQHTPVGAIHSQYEEDGVYLAKQRELRTKLYTACAMPDDMHVRLRSRKPEMLAWPSTKYEWGKQRAIYGVDFTNFVHSTFAFGDMEEVLSKVFPIGSSARPEAVKNTISEISRDGIPFCFDFEDFNSQHTISNMQMVMLAYKNVFSDVLTHEQLASIDWVIQSVNEMKIKCPERGWYKATATLLSGWRLTTAINTVLNYVYTQQMTGDVEVPSTHNGDDVFSSVTKLRTVRDFERNARKHKIRFQSAKCFLGSIAEFLRVDHRNGGGGQYLARGVATFIHGPTESVIPNDLTSLLKSMETRRTELLERNANPCVVNKFFVAMMKYVAKIWRKTLGELSIIYGTHVSLGGLSEEVTEASTRYQIVRTVIKKKSSSDEGQKCTTQACSDETEEVSGGEVTHTEDAEEDRTYFPGAWAYARAVTRRIIDKQYLQQIANAATRAIRGTTLDVKFGARIETIRPGLDAVMRANQYGMFRGAPVGAKAIMALAHGVPMLAIGIDENWVGEMLRLEKDPLDTLRAWF